MTGEDTYKQEILLKDNSSKESGFINEIYRIYSVVLHTYLLGGLSAWCTYQWKCLQSLIKQFEGTICELEFELCDAEMQKRANIKKIFS